MTPELQSRLCELIEQHCQTLRGEAADIDAALAAWPEGERPQDATLRQARAAAHKLKGSSGTIGFGGISGRAAELETLLESGTAGPGADNRDAIMSLNRLLQQEVSTLVPQQSSLYRPSP